MSEVTKNSLEKILPQLKCHFTWNLFKEDSISRDLEDRVYNQIEFLNPEFKATMYNLLAYIKHCKGHNEAALECLQQAEELIQQEHTGQPEIRSLVTWGNFAWVYYHMDRLSEAQIYVDKVKQACKKFSNPYSIECPELDCEEGWTRLKCGRNERAKVCFQKALEEKPNNPEFSSGLAIAMYCLDENPQKQFPVNALMQAIELDPDNQYVKVLLALKLQKTNKEAEGEQLLEEVLEKAPCQTDVLRSAAKFYRKKGDLDKAIELLNRALKFVPYNSFLCHQIEWFCKAKNKQIHKREESEAIGNREKYAMEHSNEVIVEGLDPRNAHSDLTECLEAQARCPTALSKELPDAERQRLRQRSCNLQEYHEKSEDTAAQHHLEDLSVSKTPTEKEEMKCQLQNLSENLPQNASNSWYLRGLNHKLNGDLLQATACYERQLGNLLRNTPSGIGSLFLSTPEHEEGSEEMVQGTGSPTPRGLPSP